MLTLSSSVRIYAALGATDMRKSFDGLSALAGEMVGADPTSGHLFLFCNRRRTQLRVLFWDGTGCIELRSARRRLRYRWAGPVS